MSRPEWFVKVIKELFPGRYTFARLTNLPVVGRIVDYSLFNGDDIVYLPKDGTIQINAPLESPQSTVLPSKIVDHFITQAKYRWVMDFCLCRSGNHCQTYPSDFGCIFLGEAVKQINPKFGRIVTRDEALEHAQRCREAGLVHMIGRNKLDSVWLGAGPSQKLLTICNCCPCCCLWSILPQLTPLIGNKVTRMPGVNVMVTERCIGCGTCSEGVCFVDAIRVAGDYAVIDDGCRGCGRCVEICPNQAIELSIGDEKIQSAMIERISPLVDIT